MVLTEKQRKLGNGLFEKWTEKTIVKTLFYLIYDRKPEEK